MGIQAEESNERRDRFGEPPVNYREESTAFAPIHHLTTRDVWAHIVENDFEYHSIYNEQAELYGGMESRGNRLLTLYDSEFDSLGARTVSNFVYYSEVAELKEIEQDSEG